MLLKRLCESLSARIFFITFFVLLGACGVTFGLVAWAAPMSYSAAANSDLREQTDALAAVLEKTQFEDCGDVIDDFIRRVGADVVLFDAKGRVIATASKLSTQIIYEDDDLVISTTAASGDAIWEPSKMSATSAVSVELKFPGSDEPVTLCATSFLQAENHVVTAMKQMAPWLLLTLLVFSLFCAWLYSRAIAKPIVRISGIAADMAELDFSGKCGGGRRDEIGRLSQSLDTMAEKLSCALDELKAANEVLRGEIEQEKELERQRLAFFSAASHELKTPITILKGQLSGMLDGVDVYQDRDKYLVRCLQVTARMEGLVREILTISRLETGGSFEKEEINLSELVQRQLELDAELVEQRKLRVTTQLLPDIFVSGERLMLAKAVGNLLSNAAVYSPEGAEIRIKSCVREGRPELTIENTGVHISQEALPRLFEAFYREEPSRSRSTGGSGLGLYIVRTILDRHGAECRIENTADGVMAVVSF